MKVSLTMNNKISTLIFIVISFLLGIILGSPFKDDKQTVYNVTIPPSAKLSTLPQSDKPIVGERAVLYWTIYNAVSEKGWRPDTAGEEAVRAVETVYGKIKE